ncbi:MAG: ArsR family transcriptional regulator [Anaerolineae bacterium]|nr:ArsR family transcriptional regulator [Anaerolineae bacterium]
MQKTRQKILEFLRQRGEATVEELSAALDDLTPVTIRHHLDVLRGEGMVATPQIRHRDTPGRPRYVYALTDRGESYFPRNVHTLTRHLLNEISTRLDEREINVIFDGIAGRMADELGDGMAGEPFTARLNRVVAHLSQRGYTAHWEETSEGFVLHTGNCPYDNIVGDHGEVCGIDMRYISYLLGAVPRRIAHIAEGDANCSYLVSHGQLVQAGA